MASGFLLFTIPPIILLFTISPVPQVRNTCFTANVSNESLILITKFDS